MKKVKIGNQIWSTENLNVDHYRNGDVIPEVKSSKEWPTLKTGAWCYYDNDSENEKEHGRLYNWYAVNDPRGLAPKGWHIPTKKEFETLVSAVKDDGNSLKSEGVGVEEGAGTNESGFSAQLSGYRNYDGHFDILGYYAYYWSSTAYDETDASNFTMNYANTDIYIGYSNEDAGFSVRVVED